MMSLCCWVQQVSSGGVEKQQRASSKQPNGSDESVVVGGESPPAAAVVQPVSCHSDNNSSSTHGSEEAWVERGDRWGSRSLLHISFTHTHKHTLTAAISEQFGVLSADVCVVFFIFTVNVRRWCQNMIQSTKKNLLFASHSRL